MDVMIKMSKLRVAHPAESERESDVLTQTVKRQSWMGNRSPTSPSPNPGAYSGMFGQRLLWKGHCAELVDGQDLELNQHRGMDDVL